MEGNYILNTPGNFTPKEKLPYRVTPKKVNSPRPGCKYLRKLKNGKVIVSKRKKYRND